MNERILPVRFVPAESKNAKKNVQIVDETLTF